MIRKQQTKLKKKKTQKDKMKCQKTVDGMARRRENLVHFGARVS